jgi:glycosyltransferase involved in cell wall biosynthesis
MDSLVKPKISIGVPCYNRPQGLRRTLEVLTSQTYENIQIVVSDNCSENPDVQTLINEFVAKDHRVTPYRQTNNIGALSNFRFVLDSSDGDYFMWASDDDVISNNFVEKMLDKFEECPEVGFCFSNIVNIDRYGHEIRSYESFSRFEGGDRLEVITRFFLEPEYLGKANPIYAMFKTTQLKSLCKETNYWELDRDIVAIDVALVLGALCRWPFGVVDEILFWKRDERPDDDPKKTKSINVDYQKPFDYEYGFRNLEKFEAYLNICVDMVRGTGYEGLIKALMPIRIALASKNLSAKRRLFKF